MADKKLQATERMYQVLMRPIMTEKSANANEHNVVVFEVASDATKPEIKTAVETLYKVKVAQVNTLNREGKLKTFRGIKGKRQDMKMAYVKLAEGQNLDISAAV